MSSSEPPRAHVAFGFLADAARFLGAVPDADDSNFFAIAGVGPQRLAEAAGVMRDETVGSGEDVRRRAVVLLKPDDLGAGEILLEAKDVGDLGAAPGIDRLVVVADDAEVAARLGEELQPFVLGLVGVLIFVDEKVAEAVAIAVEHVAVLAEDHQHVEQEVAEIAGIEGPQSVLILRVELGAAPGREGFGFAGIDLLRRPAAVLPAVDEAGELARGPALLVKVCRLDQLFEDAQLIVGVEDREVGLEADQLGMAAKHPRRDRMEGAEPRHALERAARKRANAFAHLARRLVGEGDGEDLARPRLAAGDEVGKASGQRRGFSGARTGEDEHRSFGRQHRLALRRVQALQVSGLRRQCRRFRHLAEVGGGERNGNRAAADR